jgi:hypothetical protein
VPGRQQGAALNDGPPRVLLIAAVAVAVVAVVVVLGIAIFKARTPQAQQQPVVIPEVPAPQAGTPECTALIGALPERLGDFQRVTLASPFPPGTAAWRAGSGEPIVLRCGVGQPTDFVVGAAIQDVNSVQWFRVDEQGTGLTTWFVVDRPVYVAVTVPSGAGATPIQAIADTVAARLPAVPIRPGPPR